MTGLLRTISRLAGPERAHAAAVAMLRAAGCMPGGRWLMRKIYSFDHPLLEREIFGLRFRNPIGVAAGFDRNGDICRELDALGFGFVEIGTVTPRPQQGNPRPRLFKLPADNAILNRIGLANKGLERTISNLRHSHKGVIVGCNIGKNNVTPPENAAADYLKVFRNLYQYADYFTVNVCYNSTYNKYVPTSRESVMELLEPLFDFRRGQNQYRPILLKISPDLSDAEIDTMTDIMLDTPLDGIVAVTGTIKPSGLQTPVGTLKELGYGAVSGAPLTRRAVEVVERIYRRSNGTYPIIGVGGLMSAGDVRTMLAAGASLVQVYTGLTINGPHFAGDICRELAAAGTGSADAPEESPETAGASDAGTDGAAGA